MKVMVNNKSKKSLQFRAGDGGRTITVNATSSEEITIQKDTFLYLIDNDQYTKDKIYVSGDTTHIDYPKDFEIAGKPKVVEIAFSNVTGNDVHINAVYPLKPGAVPMRWRGIPGTQIPIDSTVTISIDVTNIDKIDIYDHLGRLRQAMDRDDLKGKNAFDIDDRHWDDVV